MMKRRNLWFLTLFSLVLVLSIYYVTMPSDLLKASTEGINIKKLTDQKVSTEITESDAIAALKVEDNSKTTTTINELQKKLTDASTSTEEKNNVYEQIKILNTNSGLEETIEKKINSTYNCNAFTKIENTNVKVVVNKCENSKVLANNIMRLVQEQFENKMYISVEFK